MNAKGSSFTFDRMQKELVDFPKKSINTLLIKDFIRIFQISQLQDYIAKLGLKYVIYQKSGKFDGWIPSGRFSALLFLENDRDRYATIEQLRNFAGISLEHVKSDASAKKVLEKMQELHVDALPVVDNEKRWQFFATRGETLAQLITYTLLSESIR